MKNKQLGFTLIELMIVVAVVAILAAIAYPSFTDALRKSRRAEAFKGLLSMQLKQEEYRISNLGYVSDAAFTLNPSLLGNPTSNYYDFGISGASSSTFYTLKATAKGAQTGDNAGGIPCATLTLDKADIKTHADCWK